jgi:hypothetical protein
MTVKTHNSACNHDLDVIHLDRNRKNSTGDFQIIKLACSKCGWDYSREFNQAIFYRPQKNDQITWKGEAQFKE